MSSPKSKQPVPPISRQPDDRSPPEAAPPKRIASTPPGLDELTATPVHDQHGTLHFRFRQGERSALVPASVVGDGAALAGALQAGGIVALTPAARGYAQGLAQAAQDMASETCHLLTRPGYERGLFVMPDGRASGGSKDAEVEVQLSNPIRSGRAGTVRGWRELVRCFGSDQSYVQFALSLAFVGPILDLLPYDGGVLFELEGATSTGKTTLLRLAASVWGAPSGPGTLAASWRLSAVGLQHLALARASCFLPLDEVNTAGVSRAQQAQIVGDAAFFLEAGVTDVHDRARAVQHVRTCMLSTSNEPLGRLLAGFDRARADAAAVRIVSVPIEAGAGLGFWTGLPDGFTDPGVAADALNLGLRDHHGRAASRFVRYMTGLRRRDEAALREETVGHVDRFVRRLDLAPADGPARRRAVKFAIVYAAGHLAIEAGVLPFASVGDAVLDVYRRTAGASRADNARRITPLERVRRHLAAHQGGIINLDSEQRPRLSDAALAASPGWLRTVAGRPCLLLRGAAMRRLFGATMPEARRQLVAEGRLVPASGQPYQNQLPVRRSEEKTRVYAIAID